MDPSPFPLADVLPDALRGVILDFHWSVERLHALELPDRIVAVDELAWHLDLPFWADGGHPFQVSPAQVRADPDRYAEQWRRAMASDLAFPLDGYVGPDNRMTVLDGVHRLLKAEILGWQSVRVRILQESDFEAIAVPRR